MPIQILAILAICSIYTVLRYIVFGPETIVQIPAFLFNKAISLASVCFLTMAAYYHATGYSERLKQWGTAALHCAYLHIVISVAIISRAYYPKFFGDDKMNLVGEMTIGFGALAAYCFWLIGINKSNHWRKQTLQILATILIGAHVTAMGLSGWLTPDKWNGGMPPISLVSFILAIISLLLFCIRKSSLP